MPEARWRWAAVSGDIQRFQEMQSPAFEECSGYTRLRVPTLCESWILPRQKHLSGTISGFLPLRRELLVTSAIGSSTLHIHIHLTSEARRMPRDQLTSHFMNRGCRYAATVVAADVQHQNKKHRKETSDRCALACVMLRGAPPHTRNPGQCWQ